MSRRIVWHGGNLNTLRAAFGTQGRLAIDAAEQIVSQTTEEAAQIQRDLLDKATTPYGVKRFGKGQGGSPGRNDSGAMIAKINTNVQTSRGNTSGSWGWNETFEQAPEIYAQELGGSPTRIPAARSLVDSFMQVRLTFLKRVSKMVGK